jgi:hypothetical protein
MMKRNNIMQSSTYTLRGKEIEFSAYTIPLGTEFVLGKRAWKLMAREENHPDFLTFKEVSACAHTPDRIYNPSEIDEMHKLGVRFYIWADACGDVVEAVYASGGAK